MDRLDVEVPNTAHGAVVDRLCTMEAELAQGNCVASHTLTRQELGKFWPHVI